jgi:hypothetical protein
MFGKKGLKRPRPKMGCSDIGVKEERVPSSVI